MKFPLRKLSPSWVAPDAIILGSVLIILIWLAIKIGFSWIPAIIIGIPLVLRLTITYVLICLDVKKGYMLIEDSAITIVRYGFYSKSYPICEIKKLLIDKNNRLRKTHKDCAGKIAKAYDKTYFKPLFWFAFDPLACELIQKASGCKIVDQDCR